MDLTDFADTLRNQDGVIARRQLDALGATKADVRRLLRRRDLVPVHPGVYVDHTGEPTWAQRAQAAVLAHWPAALTGPSAMPRPPMKGPIDVAISRRRTVTRLPGVRANRMADFDQRVSWNRSPPRVRLEHVALDLAAHAIDEPAAFTVLADACQTRETTPGLLRTALAGRTRLRRGRVLRAMLDDLETGSCSVLERGYATRVRRPHGLPAGRPQAPATTNDRRAYRDVLLEEQRLVVELDGRAFHDNAAARDADHERDLVAAAESDLLTLRLTYGQVFRTPCRTAARLAAVLERRGWTGRLHRCPDCP